MARDGLIPKKVITNITNGSVFFQAHPLVGLESLKLGRNVSTNKTQIVREIIRDEAFRSRRFTGKPTNPSPTAVNSEPLPLIYSRTFIVAENDPKYLRAMAKELSAASTEYGARHSNYVLYNAASPKDRKNFFLKFQENGLFMNLDSLAMLLQRK